MTERVSAVTQSDIMDIGPLAADFVAAGIVRVRVTREPVHAQVTAPRRLPRGALLHPVASVVGTAAAQWRGLHAFHAASVQVGDGCYLICGGTGAGKSTVTAALHRAGMTVLGDDLAVVDHGAVLRGAPVIDLREASAVALGLGDEPSTHGFTERWRILTRPAPPRLPLRGVVELAWGTDTVVEHLDVASRLGVLARHTSSGPGPTAASGLLELLTVPVARLVRPRGFAALADLCDVVADLPARLGG